MRGSTSQMTLALAVVAALGLFFATNLSITWGVLSDLSVRLDQSLPSPVKAPKAGSGRGASNRAGDDPIANGWQEAEDNDVDDDDRRASEDDVPLEIKSRVSAAAKEFVSQHQEWIDMNDIPATQQRYKVNDRQRDECLSETLEFEKNRKRSGPSLESGTVHDRLYATIRKLTTLSTCATSKQFVVYKAPHFSGGRRQFLRYFDENSWEGVTEMPYVANRSAFEEVPENTVIMVASCLHHLPFPAIHRRTQLVSMSPTELKSALKIPFYKAIRKLFDDVQCDYRTFHPESFLLENSHQCKEALAVIKAEPPKSDAIWFLKSTQDSFGDGVRVRTTETAIKDLRECSPLPRKLFIQRGVPRIMKHQGRTSQGRAYFLISSYDPVTVWLFMGYFNIAADPVVEDQPSNATTPSGVSSKKSAHVTNTRENQASPRLLFHQFLAGKSRDELRVIKKHIKEAALTAFMALRPKLGRNKGSYTMFGFDYLVQEDLNVKVLETNCNCELFINKDKHGLARTTISTNLVDGMFDIVLASNLSPKAFSLLLTRFIQKEGSRMRDDDESLSLDDAQHPIRRSWELLYSEAVKPAYSVMDFENSCLKIGDSSKGDEDEGSAGEKEEEAEEDEIEEN